MINSAESYSKSSSDMYTQGMAFMQTLNLQLAQDVVDIGCGTGELTADIAKKVGENGRVWGIDPQEDRITFAKEQFKEVKNLTFLAVGISDIPQEDSFDVVFSSGVFTRISKTELESSLSKIHKRHLKPGGIIAIQTLNFMPLLQQISDNLPEEDKDELLSTIQLRSGEEYEQIFKNAGFDNITWEIKECVETFKSTEEVLSHLLYCTDGTIDARKVPPEKRKNIKCKTTPSGEGLLESRVLILNARK